MSGISDKAPISQYVENKCRFNFGSELQNKEFSDGSGLEPYDAQHRMYDPQLGRFGQVDPIGDAMPYYSPYSFGSNDPVSHVDPFGLTDSVVTTKTTNLPAVYVYAHKRDETPNWLNYPHSGASERSGWAANQSRYYDRLNQHQALEQDDDPVSYCISLKRNYKPWTQAEKESRAMQAWVVGIISAPALIGASPEVIAWGVDFEIKRHVAAFAVDGGLQIVGNAIEHQNILENYNFVSGGAALLIGVPEGASMQNVIGVSAFNATLGTSVNVSAASLKGRAPVLSFNPLSILIGTAFGPSGYYASGAIRGGNLGDRLISPLNVTGQSIDSGTKPKEQ